MSRRQPGPTLTSTLFPYTTLFRSPARGPSLPGDLLLIERSIDDGLLFRLTVISQTGPLFALVQPRTGGRRWGLLAGGTIPVPESEVDDALAEMEQRQATPFDQFDASLVYQPATKRIARSRAFRTAVIAARSEKRRVGKEGVRTVKS